MDSESDGNVFEVSPGIENGGNFNIPPAFFQLKQPNSTGIPLTVKIRKAALTAADSKLSRFFTTGKSSFVFLWEVLNRVGYFTASARLRRGGGSRRRK